MKEGWEARPLDVGADRARGVHVVKLQQYPSSPRTQSSSLTSRIFLSIMINTPPSKCTCGMLCLSGLCALLGYSRGTPSYLSLLPPPPHLS